MSWAAYGLDNIDGLYFSSDTITPVTGMAKAVYERIAVLRRYKGENTLGYYTNPPTIDFFCKTWTWIDRRGLRNDSPLNIVAYAIGEAKDKYENISYEDIENQALGRYGLTNWGFETEFYIPRLYYYKLSIQAMKIVRYNGQDIDISGEFDFS